MKAIAIKNVNTRLSSSTDAKKLNPVLAGSSIEVNSIEFGEKYRGNNIWLVNDNGKHYWSGAFNYDLNQVSIIKSKRLNEIGITELWKYNMGDNIKIGVIDCGININHKSLLKAKVEVRNEGDTKCLHGTYMTSIIAGKNINDGYTGVAPNAEIVFYGFGKENKLNPQLLQNILQKLEDVDIVNMSFRSDIPEFKPKNAAAQALINYLNNKWNNKILVAATGNESSQKGNMYYPAAYSEVISVSAFKPSEMSIDRRANFWEGVTITDYYDAFFEGVDSESEDFEGKDYQGTSGATAFLSGVFGLILSKFKTSGQNIPLQNIIELCSDTVNLISEKTRKSFKTKILNKNKLLTLLKS